MNIVEITKDWLKKNGYDGLYQLGECSCSLNDLFPCGELYVDCKAGYINEVDPEIGYDFFIGPEPDKSK